MKHNETAAWEDGRASRRKQHILAPLPEHPCPGADSVQRTSRNESHHCHGWGFLRRLPRPAACSVVAAPRLFPLAIISMQANHGAPVAHSVRTFGLGALAFTAGLAAQKEADPGPLREAAIQAFANRANQDHAGWRAFQAQHPGKWFAHWNPATGTPRAIFGEGLPIADWRENTLEEARRHAGLLLVAQQDLLGLGTSEFRESIGTRIGRQWSFTYDQYFRGLPVVGGRADVRISMAGRVAMFGSSAWPIPAEFDTTPLVDAAFATAAAWNHLGQSPTGVKQPAASKGPRLLIWGDAEATAPAAFHLAWEVPISNVDANGAGPIGAYYVDARTGAVLHYRSDKHECGMPGCALGGPAAPETIGPAAPLPAPVNTTVTVRAWLRAGLDANDPITNQLLPGLELNVPGIGLVTTDNNGQFTINIAAAVNITVGQLDGRHHGLMAGANAPSGTFTVTPGVATTIQLLTAGASVNEASHPTTSFWMDRVNEYSRSILGNSAQLNTADACVPTVNIANTCNAYYTNNTVNFYQAGGGCTNTATATIVAHEWGHGLDDRYGGISQTNGLSEGWGDIMGMYLVDDPRVGSGFQTAGVGLRNGNNTRQYPTGSGVHAQGESWMGFAWKLRDRLATTYANRSQAITRTNTIVVGTIAANATNQQAAVLEVFLADDNDGNLNNGTPNYADLVWACNQHSLPYPGLQAPANDECANAITVVNGINGPYSSSLATTSTPSWPCAAGGADVWFRYLAGANGTLTVSTCGQAAFDTAIQIFSGSCASLTSLGCLDDSCGLQTSLSVPVTPGVVLIRVGGYNSATGSFSLDINGPAGVPASTTAYGTGCYRLSKAFYELFPSAGFDLGGASMRLSLANNAYTVQAGGSYVAPTGGATSLSLSDDSQVTVNLTGTLAYPGGTTTSLVVCSNGFVSPVTGNGTAFTPTAATWLTSVQPRWGTWHDFNPAASGSGAVKFEQIGNIAYVTWDGVYSFGTTSPNTWQLQFNLSTGAVTFAWPSIVSSGNAWLVGYAGAAPNSDLGSMDLSVALAGTFRTWNDNVEALALTSTLPVLGTTAVLTTTNFPAAVVVGAQAVSLVQFNPGIDLTSAGMPGCFRLTNLESVVVVLPAGGQTTSSIAIPNSFAYMGLPLNCQTWGLYPGINATGAINSNAVRMIIGL